MKKFARFWKDKDRSESRGADAPAPFTDIQRAASPEPRLSYIKHDSRRRSDRFSLRRRRQPREAPPRRAESCETLYEAPGSPGGRQTAGPGSPSPGRLARSAAVSAEDLSRGEETWRRSGSQETLQRSRGPGAGTGTRLGWSWRWKRGSSADRAAISAAADGPASARAGPPAASLDDFLGSVLSVAAGEERMEAERDPPVSPDQGYRSSGRSTEELHSETVQTGADRALSRTDGASVVRPVAEELQRGEVQREIRESAEVRPEREHTPVGVAERGGVGTLSVEQLEDASVRRGDNICCDINTGSEDATAQDRDAPTGYRDVILGMRRNEPRSRSSVLGLMLPDESLSLEPVNDAAAASPVSNIERGNRARSVVQLQTNLIPVRQPDLPRTPRHLAITGDSAVSVGVGGGGSSGGGGAPHGGMYHLADSPPSSDDTPDTATEDGDALIVGADELRAAQRRCQQAWRAAGAVPCRTSAVPPVPVPALRYRPAPPYRERDPLAGAPLLTSQQDRPPPYQPRTPDRAEESIEEGTEVISQPQQVRS